MSGVLRVVAAVLFAGVLSLGIMAQSPVPAVEVFNQVSVNGMVTVASVFNEGPGWIVIHADNGEGRPGPIVGYRAINDGWSYNVDVMVDAAGVTPTLFAMLHADTNEIGVYEFGQVEGADGPVRVNDAVVTPPFQVELIRAFDQYVEMNTLKIAAVVTQQDGFIVIHQDNGEGRPGPVIGYAPVTAGANLDVEVTLDGEITRRLFPMMHVDTGVAGEYEFGTVEGADTPVFVDGVMAVMGITSNTPTLHVPDQIVTDSVYVASVTLDGPGWVVIHQDNGEGRPGPVIGAGLIEAGTTTGLSVSVDAAGVTPILFPMLHVDTGVAGEYEFGTVEGTDGPVRVDDAVLTFPIQAAPAITYSGTLSTLTLMVDAALIDAQGWLVIHADDAGRPGAVLGYTPLVAGLNRAISVEVSEGAGSYFPMLHYDTGEPGSYEFGTVDGADGPVRVGDAVVTGPMTPVAE